MKRLLLLLLLGLMINAFALLAQATPTTQASQIAQLKDGETYLINVRGSTCVRLYMQQMVIQKKGNVYVAKYFSKSYNFDQSDEGGKILASKTKQLTQQDLKALVEWERKLAKYNLAEHLKKVGGKTIFDLRLPGGKRIITQREHYLRGYLTKLFNPIWQLEV